MTRLVDRVSQKITRLLTTGVIWPLLAAAFLLLATVFPWITVPLLQSVNSWALPVDLGWGIQNGLFSYGLLSTLIACLCLGRILLAPDWGRLWGGHWLPWQPLPLRVRSLVLMGCMAASISLLFVFQCVLVDFHLMTGLASQTNQALLIRKHLGYTVPPLYWRLEAFKFGLDTPQDRLSLLAQLATSAPLLPFLGGLFCFCGALFTWRTRRKTRWLPLAPEPGRKVSPWRVAFWIAVGVLGTVLLARAPLGAFIEHQGVQALGAGQYHDALTLFARAEAFTPSLHDLPNFHQERGEALYLLNKPAESDSGLYLAEQEREAGALNQAWLEDSALSQQYPQDALIQADLALTLEMLAEQNTHVALTPVDDEAAQQNPQLPLQLTSSGPDQALPWLDTLLHLQPDNVYAHYLRGRILFTAQNYELATQEFQTILNLSADNNMQSAAYTYLAFCRGDLGDYVGEFVLLHKAVELDHGYYNTTAREAASGLH